MFAYTLSQVIAIGYYYNYGLNLAEDISILNYVWEKREEKIAKVQWAGFSKLMKTNNFCFAFQLHI